MGRKLTFIPILSAIIIWLLLAVVGLLALTGRDQGYSPGQFDFYVLLPSGITLVSLVIAYVTRPVGEIRGAIRFFAGVLALLGLPFYFFYHTGGV